jgi:hypothetical protein
MTMFGVRGFVPKLAPRTARHEADRRAVGRPHCGTEN